MLGVGKYWNGMIDFSRVPKFVLLEYLLQNNVCRSQWGNLRLTMKFYSQFCFVFCDELDTENLFFPWTAILHFFVNSIIVFIIVRQFIQSPKEAFWEEAETRVFGLGCALQQNWIRKIQILLCWNRFRGLTEKIAISAARVHVFQWLTMAKVKTLKQNISVCACYIHFVFWLLSRAKKKTNPFRQKAWNKNKRKGFYESQNKPGKKKRCPDDNRWSRWSCVDNGTWPEAVFVELTAGRLSESLLTDASAGRCFDIDRGVLSLKVRFRKWKSQIWMRIRQQAFTLNSQLVTQGAELVVPWTFCDQSWKICTENGDFCQCSLVVCQN